jgi:hypothetical protein
MTKGQGFTFARVPANRRAKRGYRVEFFQGGSFRTEYVPWSHYDLACDYLARSGNGALNDVGEVLVNFEESELRDILAKEK